jgi:hypothetical protein
MKVVGCAGLDIGKKWKSDDEGPSSYLGTVSYELPNFFMFFGPHAVNIIITYGADSMNELSKLTLIVWCFGFLLYCST